MGLGYSTETGLPIMLTSLLKPYRGHAPQTKCKYGSLLCTFTDNRPGPCFEFWCTFVHLLDRPSQLRDEYLLFGQHQNHASLPLIRNASAQQRRIFLLTSKPRTPCTFPRYASDKASDKLNLRLALTLASVKSSMGQCRLMRACSYGKLRGSTLDHCFDATCVDCRPSTSGSTLPL